MERHYWLQKKPLSVRARSVVCYWAVTEMGMTTVDVARFNGIGQSAVTNAVQRGGTIVKESGIQLIE